jgi:hypothetical protein
MSEMVTPYVRIHEWGATPRSLIKNWRKIQKEALRDGGVFWHGTFLPIHFTREAYQRYGFMPRMGEGGTASKNFKRSYTGRKLRKWGHTNPLVWSGISRRLATARRPNGVRATAQYCRIPIPAPALNFRPKGGRINLRREVLAIIQPEVDAVARIAQRSTTARIKRIRHTETITVSG